jgi:hypothetical protein
LGYVAAVILGSIIVAIIIIAIIILFTTFFHENGQFPTIGSSSSPPVLGDPAMASLRA